MNLPPQLKSPRSIILMVCAVLALITSVRAVFYFLDDDDAELLQIPPEQLVEQIMSPTDDMDHEQQVRAAQQLARYGNKALPQIRRVFTTNSNREIRGHMMDGLGKARDVESVPQLMDAMRSEDRLLRGRANAAVNKIFKADFHFSADDSPERRAMIIALIDKLYRGALQHGTFKNN